MSAGSGVLTMEPETVGRASTGSGEPPIWKQMLPWILLWPMLNLIARQAPFLSGPARTTAQITQGAAAGGYTDYHPTLFVMLAFELVSVLLAARQLLSLLQRNLLLLGCLVLPVVSCLWSDNIGNSLRLGAQTALCTLFSGYLYVRFPTERLMRFLLFLGIISALLSAATAIALPSYGIFAEYAGGAWQGISDHKNTLGVTMMYLLTPIFFLPRLRRFERVLYALLILFTIGMSQSRGAWIETIALLSLIAFMFLLKRLPPTEAWLALIVGSGIGLAVIVAFISSFDVIAPMLGKDSTMSGRSEIYRQLWLAAKEAPFLGYGYGGFWGTNPKAFELGLRVKWTNIGYAENGVLELALQLGAVGALVVGLLIGRAIFQGVRLFRDNERFWRTGWYLSILILAILTNIDAGWLLVSNTLDWVLIVIAILGLRDEFFCKPHG